MDANHCKTLKISAGYTTVSISSIVSGFLGTLGNLVLLCGLIWCKFLPVNVRFLLGNMTFAILLMIVLAGMEHFNKVMEIFMGHLTGVSPFVCTFNSSVSVVTTAVVITSLGSLGIERWYSTSHVIPRLAMSKPPLMTKENHTRAIRLLVAAIWIFSILTWAVMFVPYLVSHTANYNETNPICSCHQREHPDVSTLIFFGVMFTYMTAEVTSILLYFRVWWLNKTRFADFSINTARHNLQERFLIRQNIQITGMMLPAVTLHAVCWFTIQLMILTFNASNISFGDESMVGREMTSMVVMFPQQVYEVLHPLLILWKSEHLRKAVKGVFFCHSQVYPTANDSTLTYGDNQPKLENENVGQPIGTAQASQVPTDPKRSGRLTPLPQGNVSVCQRGAVEFKIKPEAHVKILEQIWSTGKGAEL